MFAILGSPVKIIVAVIRPAIVTFCVNPDPYSTLSLKKYL